MKYVFLLCVSWATNGFSQSLSLNDFYNEFRRFDSPEGAYGELLDSGEQCSIHLRREAYWGEDYIIMEIRGTNGKELSALVFTDYGYINFRSSGNSGKSHTVFSQNYRTDEQLETTMCEDGACEVYKIGKYACSLPSG